MIKVEYGAPLPVLSGHGFGEVMSAVLLLYCSALAQKALFAIGGNAPAWLARLAPAGLSCMLIRHATQQSIEAID